MLPSLPSDFCYLSKNTWKGPQGTSRAVASRGKEGRKSFSGGSSSPCMCSKEYLGAGRGHKACIKLLLPAEDGVNQPCLLSARGSGNQLALLPQSISALHLFRSSLMQGGWLCAPACSACGSESFISASLACEEQTGCWGLAGRAPEKRFQTVPLRFFKLSVGKRL